MLNGDDFPAFFAAANDGHGPFQWQRRLAEQLIATGRWPDRIAAPTGAGKTSVIDIHVFAVAVANSSKAAIRPPRRLAMVVDRRALVDDQYERALRLAKLLHSPKDEVVLRVASALAPLRHRVELDEPGDRDHAEDSPLLVARLRGGQPPPRLWRDDPTACAIICATPDMWGSRLLFRGYGTSRDARPVEAGLLAWDTAVVLDEAHLNRQLLMTARRVRTLAASSGESNGPPPLAVIETTATPGTSEGTEVGVEDSDLELDEPLRRRLTRPKPVRMVAIADWPAEKPAAARAVADRLATEAGDLLARFGRAIGCFVNTVSMALEVTALLRQREHEVEVVCGRLRPHDLAALRKRHPGLLSATGEQAEDSRRPAEILVATQSLEVGVDLDLAAAVTELAPATALAQRAGRVNRTGGRNSTELVVLGPEAAPSGHAGPYEADELKAALDWIGGRSADPCGLAPVALTQDPPAPRATRTLHRLEAWDVWHLERTSFPQAAEPDLDVWLSDDLELDLDVGVVVRDDLTGDVAHDRIAVSTVRPRPAEVAPVGIGVARKLAAEAGTGVLLHADDIVTLPSAAVRPGATLVLPSAQRLAQAGVITRDGEEQLSDVADQVAHADRRANLRLSLEAPLGEAFGENPVRAMLNDAAEFDRLDARGRKGLQGRAGRMALGRLLQESAQSLGDGIERDQLRRVAAVLRNGPLAHLDVALVSGDEADDGDPPPPIALFIGDRRRRPDEGTVQFLSPAQDSDAVPLERHRSVVEDRARTLATEVGLAGDEARSLELAGLHHDDGKGDPRFQVVLGRSPEDLTLRAKSVGMTKASREAARAASGLPGGWRHEQLSAAIAWRAMATEPPSVRRLTVRLVGTSHGAGRPWFGHGPDELVPADHPDRETVVAIFEDGQWDELVERLGIERGAWRMAYLEALIRAADHQVSKEGN